MLLILLISLLLPGCDDENQVERKNMQKDGAMLGLRQLKKKPKHIDIHALHRRCAPAGIGSIYGLFFAKDISIEDKAMLEDNVQAALEANESREWQGRTVACAIEVGRKYVVRGFMCHEFSLIFAFGNDSYEVTNKACKIYLNDNGTGYWALEDSIENYME